MNEFNSLTIPLTGRNLIEASAGTGKTYTICTLVLRLILEKDLTIDQILVVTYTEAATEDLRAQVRKKLRQACEVLQTGVSDEPLLAQLLQPYLAGEPAYRARLRLTEALRNFDEAAIFTIHGFCQRMLKENSFESGLLFDTELISDEQGLKKEIVEDFWRLNLYEETSLFGNYLRQYLRPEALCKFLDRILHKPDLIIIPEDGGADPAVVYEVEKEFQAAFTEICRAWPGARTAVEKILTSNDSLNRARYRKNSLPAWIAAMDIMTAAEFPDPELFDKFSKFTTPEISRATKKNATPPSHPFFDLCTSVQQASVQLLAHFSQRLTATKRQLFSYAEKELTHRKGRLNLFSFDDLLVHLRRGLAGRKGAELAQAIAAKYPAALIDEFQDTDPVQYEIFQTIYAEAGSIAGNNAKTLFLIGDPKQAIYSFRGADIFTYMLAANDLPEKAAPHTLTTNWRSTPGLVAAVNSLFSRGRVPFIFKEIPFIQVHDAGPEKSKELTIAGRTASPFHLWFIKRTESGIKDGESPPKLMPAGPARQKILAAVTNEIASLLNLSEQGEAMLGDRKLLPSDIAVLVRTNREARLMEKSLAAAQVPNVIHSTESLFASPEAQELELVLGAIADPGSEVKLKAALATRIMGVSAEELDILNKVDSGAKENAGAESSLEQWLTVFGEANAIWQRSGLMPMFRAFMARNAIRSRLLALTKGERRLTNLLHLLEVLHRDALALGLGVTRLVGHLSERLAEPPDHEDFQLRLESDADCVRIVTIHKAKGLEYPVVFCPFSWNGSTPQGQTQEFFCHRKNAQGNGYDLLLDIGSPEQVQHERLAARETLAENIRLLYVALTRARSICYLAWGALNGAETSALAYLLHQAPYLAQSAEDPSLDPVQGTAARFLGLSDEDLLADLAGLAGPGKAILVSPIPESEPVLYSRPNPADRPLTCPPFSGKITGDWKTTSFSAMIHGHYHGAELPDYDSNDLPAEPPAGPPETGRTIFTFPHGTGPGTFLHDLLEHLDFSQPPPKDYIPAKLAEFGFDPGWQATLNEMIDNLRNTPLPGPAGTNGRSRIRLAAITNQQRLNELEFYFSLLPVTVKTLKNIFAKAPGSAGFIQDFTEQLTRLDFAPTRGFLKGFIDLVFELEGRYYIVDWKSNHLGNSREDYRQDRLIPAMQQGFYTLQYHIYATALHNYLQNRLPGYSYDANFGGVFYIFLRGVDRNHGPEYGIFHDRPHPDLIAAMSAALVNRRGG